MHTTSKSKTIEYEANGKVIPVRVFRKRRVAAECARVLEEHKKKDEFAPVPMKSLFGMILNGD